MNERASQFRSIGVARVAIGVAAGAAISLLTDAAKGERWPATEPALFIALILVCAFTPIVVLGGLGQLRGRTLAIWTASAALALTLLGAYDGFRGFTANNGLGPSPQALFLSAAALFIVHHLIAGGDQHRRLRAPYSSYFEIAWKHGVQLGLSVAFTGAFWLLLLLGSELFRIIGIEAFRELLQKSWFAFPATGAAFAAAVHLTDVRSGLVIGIRTVALTLLSWLMPLMAAITAAFLAALPFTGLGLLFDTGDASRVLLGAAGALIILLNAAYQDGEDIQTRPPIIRWLGRLSALLLPPLVILAAYAILLRIGQYGLTTERVLALACIVVGAGYAIGYPLAAARGGAWMRGLEPTNIITAGIAVLVILLLLSPIADPARLSVADQIRRLDTGKVAPDKFDYRFLRFETGRYGNEALQRLATRREGPGAAVIANRAREALKLKSRYDQGGATVQNIRVLPAGRTLPEKLELQIERGRFADGCDQANPPCVALFIDTDADGRDELLFARARAGGVLLGEVGEDWEVIGEVPLCATDRAALAEGRRRLVPSLGQDLEIEGRRLSLPRPVIPSPCLDEAPQR